MMCRHAEGSGLDKLLREWEVWGSERLGSYLSYLMLAYYRSWPIHANLACHILLRHKQGCTFWTSQLPGR